MGLFSFKKTDDDVGSSDAKKIETSKIELAEPDKGNEYTELFSKDANKSIKSDESSVLDSVVSTADKSEKKNILDLKNQHIDTSSFIDQDYHLRKQLSFARGLFFFLVFSSISLLGYFFIELNSSIDILTPYLGRNTTQTLSDLDEKLVSTQTKLNEYRYLSSKIYLDDFSYNADKFLHNFDIYSSNEDSVTKSSAELRLIDLQDKLAQSFEKVKSKLLSKGWVTVNEDDDETEARIRFIGLLKDHFADKRNVIQKTNQKGAAVKQKLIDEIDQALTLVGNGELIAALKTSDFSNLSYGKVKEVVDKINSSTSNSLSYIYQIKKNRIRWSDVWKEIDFVAKKTDPSYNNGFFEQIGGIQFNSYQFDTNSGRIIVTGQVKSDDASNFSLIATIIDNFGKSKMFKDVSMRSFAKSGNPEDGYTSTVKLDFILQNPDDFDPTDAGELLDEDVATLSFQDEDKITVKKIKSKTKRK